MCIQTYTKTSSTLICCYTTQTGLDGLDTFVDENDIRAVADYLEDRVAYVSEDEPEWRVYPKLTFPCRGRINSISTLAYFDASDATVGVEMQLWMPNTTAGVPGTPAEDSDSFLGDRMESRPFSPSPSEDGGQCGRRYHLLSDSTHMLFAQHERGDPPGVQRVSLRFEELEVPAEAIIALRQVEGVVLYQRGESGPPSFPVPADGRGIICLPGSNDDSSDENHDFPLIYVNLGKT